MEREWVRGNGKHFSKEQGWKIEIKGICGGLMQERWIGKVMEAVRGDMEREANK